MLSNGKDKVRNPGLHDNAKIWSERWEIVERVIKVPVRSQLII
jgi:hypothetical protein